MTGQPDAQQRRQFRAALQAAEASRPPMEPTAEDVRNGWSAQALTAYHAEQAASQSLRMDPSSVLRRKPRPIRANSKYRPLRWRG